MSAENESVRQFAGQLKPFLDQISTVWKSYQENGPGRVEKRLYDGVETSAEQLLEQIQNADVVETLETKTEFSPEELRKSIEQIQDLSHRCVFLPQGLCFISGEAGLIPRKDQVDGFEQSLEMLSECCSRMVSS